MLEKWERTSGAEFEAEKTSFIYLIRSKEAGKDITTPLRFRGKEVLPQKRLRFLVCWCSCALESKVQGSMPTERKLLVISNASKIPVGE